MTSFCLKIFQKKQLNLKKCHLELEHTTAVFHVHILQKRSIKFNEAVQAQVLVSWE